VSFDAVAVGRRVLRTEAEALGLMSDGLGAPFEAAVEALAACKGRIVCTGVGKSGHVARKLAATFASTGAPALFVHAAEASHGDLGMIESDDVVVALSKSGEVRELADVVGYARRFAIPLIAVTAEPGSALGRAADIVLQLADAAEATGEVSAPTTSTTLQMALGDALAVALLERRGFTARDFHVFHPGGKLGAMLRTVADLMHRLEEAPLAPLGTPMGEAVRIMTERRLGIIGIVDGAGLLVGVITDGDLRRNLDRLDGAVDTVMSRSPRTVDASTLAGEAARLMSESRITVLFVVEDGRPLGVLHVHDVLAAGVV
jgi:arabinose-5-phosphate isomerase